MTLASEPRHTHIMKSFIWNFTSAASSHTKKKKQQNSAYLCCIRGTNPEVPVVYLVWGWCWCLVGTLVYCWRWRWLPPWSPTAPWTPVHSLSSAALLAGRSAGLAPPHPESPTGHTRPVNVLYFQFFCMKQDTGEKLPDRLKDITTKLSFKMLWR